MTFDKRVCVVVAFGPGAECGNRGAADVFILFWHDIDWWGQALGEPCSGARVARPTEWYSMPWLAIV